MWIRSITNPATDLGPTGIVLRLTAIILLLRPMGAWGVRPLILGMAGLAIVLPRVLKAPVTWYALSALVTARIVTDWPLPDNHVYLLAYWCLAVALALSGRDSMNTLGRSSRLLIGFAFLMAVVWKGLLSPDYLDGRFFSVTLLTDGRFEDTTLLLGGLTTEQLRESREFLHPLPQGAEWAEEPLLFAPPAFRVLTLVFTWSLLVMEALIAFAYLTPLPERLVLLRHALLLLFCVATYAFAPVAGFGWLLLTMGMALCGPQQQWLRATYIAAWGLVLLYQDIPWAGLFLKWFREG